MRVNEIIFITATRPRKFVRPIIVVSVDTSMLLFRFRAVRVCFNHYYYGFFIIIIIIIQQ